MELLLLLVHRIPYPPNKGDKIRSYNLLKFLAKRYRVYLATFVDDPNDWQYVEYVSDLCEKACVLALNPTNAKITSLIGLLTHEALTIPYYRNSEMQEWVDDVIKVNGIGKIMIFSSAMAQYVNHDRYVSARRIIDFVDIDSDKWRQYSLKKSWPMSWLYRREANRLFKYERSISMKFDASIFVSAEEASLYRELVPEAADRIIYFNNGVDCDYFNPDNTYPSPYAEGEKVLVFTGAMDYWANVDAVVWFAYEIFPEVYSKVKNARFYIVGSRPTQEVKRLDKIPGVVVTGSVLDVRPYLAHSYVAVAPLRIARGVQNKVLEAMAMGKPVLTTTAAIEGISATSGNNVLVANEPAAMRTLATRLINDYPNTEMGNAARDFVLQNYNWDKNLSTVSYVLERGVIR